MFETPLLLGHRGSPRQARENTLESFRLALEAGLDGLELDLHRTKDGVLAVHHDFDLDGTPLSSLAWGELHVRAPWLPRLEQVFELAEAFPRCRLNLELKSNPEVSDGREQALADLLAAWPGRDRAWVSSFDPLALIRLRKLGAPTPLALLYYREELLELLPCLGVQGVHPHFSLLSAEKVAELKAKGLFVCTWTVNDAAQAGALLEWGVDAVIGDLPEVLKASAGR